MQIIRRIDDFLFTLFPLVSGSDKDALISAVIKFYTIGPYKPKVLIENERIRIDIDTPAIALESQDYQKVVSLCDQRRYAAARPILGKLIAQNPAVSEYYRVTAQIFSDKGDQDKAIDCLIDTLHRDSKNG